MNFKGLQSHKRHYFFATKNGFLLVCHNSTTLSRGPCVYLYVFYVLCLIFIHDCCQIEVFVCVVGLEALVFAYSNFSTSE